MLFRFHLLLKRHTKLAASLICSFIINILVNLVGEIAPIPFCLRRLSVRKTPVRPSALDQYDLRNGLARHQSQQGSVLIDDSNGLGRGKLLERLVEHGARIDYSQILAAKGLSARRRRPP